MRKTFSALFCFLILIFCAFSSLHFQGSFSWRQSPIFNLDFAQKEALKKISFPIKITAYLRSSPQYKREIKALISELKKIKDVDFEIKNPEFYPLEISARKVEAEGQLWLENQINSEGVLIKTASPASLISALLELSGAKKESIAHIVGDGERGISERQSSWQGVYDLLKHSNFLVSEINLSQSINIPQNAKIAVFSNSSGNKAAHWEAAIKTYIEGGGNLIFSTDIENTFFPPYLAQISGLELLDGTVVDLQSQVLGFADPRVIPAEFPIENPITGNLEEMPLLAGAVAFNPVQNPKSGWQRTSLLRSSLQSWNETSPVYGSISLDGEEKKGPLSIVWLLSRDLGENKQQKILILGDSDIFTRENINRGGNADFAKAVFAFFSEKETVSDEKMQLKDQFIKLTKGQEIMVAFFLIFILPLLVLGLGILIRKKFQNKYK